MGRRPINPELRGVLGVNRNNPGREKNTSLAVEKGRPEPTSLITEDPLTTDVFETACDALEKIGVLTTIDIFLLEAMAVNYAEFIRCAQALRMAGHVDQTAAGGSKVSAESQTFSRLGKDHLNYLKELGLTPSARQSLGAAFSAVLEASKADEQANATADLIKKLAGG